MAHAAAFPAGSTTEGPDHLLGGGDQGAVGHQVLQRRPGRGPGSGRPPGAGPPRGPGRARPPPPPPAAAGLRRSIAWAAHRASMARARRTFATTRRSLQAGRPAHGHVVLLVPRGRDRVDRGRVGEHLAVGHQGRRRVLGQHQARVEARVAGQERRQVVVEGRVEQPVDPPLGDVGQLGQGDGQEVEHEGQRLAVEVADRDHLVGLGEHHRVVGDRAQLALHHLAGEGDHVPAGPVDLGGAAQRVGVLDGVVGVAVAGQDGRPGEHGPEVGRAGHLAGMGAELVEAGLEGPVGAEQALDRHGAGHIGHGGQGLGVGHGQAGKGEHPLGPVDQRQALLERQPERLQPGLPQALGGGQAAAVDHDLALAEQRQGQVGELGQVTGGADRAVLGDHRGDPGGQQGDQRLHHQRPDPGVALGEGAGPQQLHAPDHLGLQRVAGGGGVRQDDPALQLLQVGRGDGGVGEQPEPGGDAVHLPPLGHRPLDHVAGRGHALAALLAQLDRDPAAGHGHHLGHAQRPAGQHHPAGAGRSIATSRHARIVGRGRTPRHALVIVLGATIPDLAPEVAGRGCRAAHLGNQEGHDSSLPR